MAHSATQAEDDFISESLLLLCQKLRERLLPLANKCCLRVQRPAATISTLDSASSGQTLEAAWPVICMHSAGNSGQRGPDPGHSRAAALGEQQPGQQLLGSLQCLGWLQRHGQRHSNGRLRFRERPAALVPREFGLEQLRPRSL